jgi:UDP-N-acetylmuramoyl-tripeptide--D-alanyl-D-alanine ligase
MTRSTPLWASGEVLAATQGRISAGSKVWQASGVSIDSRTCEPGDLFVSVSGDQFDGHDFVAQAFEAGARAAIVSHTPEGLADEATLVEVDDSLVALEGLGRAARDRADASVIGVTGSVGKTGTKEALSLAFGALGKTHATQGNLNNHIGVPLTLARLPRDAKFSVIEMGMNHSNEISDLSKLARPDVAIITTIAAVHLEFFDKIADIADAKSEIFDGMRKDATAILNRDNVYFTTLAARAREHGLQRVVGFGEHPESDALLSASTVSDKGSDITAKIGDQVVRYYLNVPGRHWIHNTLAVLASVHALDGDVNTAADALASLSAPKGRGARIEILFRDGILTVIDDSYNASPASMRAAIGGLASGRPKHGGRRIAILGDMLELGETAPKLHAALAQDLKNSDVDLVFCAGENMRALHAELPAAMCGDHAENSEKLVPAVLNAVRAGDIVMVKGSLGSCMAIIVDALAGMDISHSSAQEAPHAV